MNPQNLSAFERMLFNFFLDPDVSWGPSTARDVETHWYHDGWQMKSFGERSVPNRSLTFWWSNIGTDYRKWSSSSTDYGNNHQGLVIRFGEMGGVTQMTLSTVAQDLARCYTIQFNLAVDGKRRFFTTDATDVNNVKVISLSGEVNPFNSVVLGFIFSMTPEFIWQAHRHH